MIQTRIYYPTDAEKFRKNVQRRWCDLYEEVASFNSKESMSKRTDKMLIYHVLDTTVLVHAPYDNEGRVFITADVISSPGRIEAAKSLLEKMSEVELIERKMK